MQVVLKESQAQEPFSFAFINAEGQSVVKSENYKAKKARSAVLSRLRKIASMMTGMR